eukprot:363728-Pelagomonas_calceolata.AAC.3
MEVNNRVLWIKHELHLGALKVQTGNNMLGEPSKNTPIRGLVVPLWQFPDPDQLACHSNQSDTLELPANTLLKSK